MVYLTRGFKNKTISQNFQQRCDAATSPVGLISLNLAVSRQFRQVRIKVCCKALLFTMCTRVLFIRPACHRGIKYTVHLPIVSMCFPGKLRGHSSGKTTNE